MKILWFEVTEPAGYRNTGEFIGGWQDSLEGIVKRYTDIDLYIVFASETATEEKNDGRITYIPVCYNQSKLERFKSLYNCNVETQMLLPQALSVIERIKPDLIHVFGLEWPWGLVADKTEIPVVIHIMGSMVPYYNALYPPKYNLNTIIRSLFPSIKDALWYYLFDRLQKSRRNRELMIWTQVSNYMGRTTWDYALSQIKHPKSTYFHVEEAIRDVFLDEQTIWNPPIGKIKLISTGSRTYWKGPDMLLKTARALKESGLDFEWNVLGGMRPSIKKVVEKIEGIRYEDCSVNILGFKNPQELKELLCQSTLYVHTAYIENSPNSICEAQCVGLPVVSTNVGGISTLVADGVNGILVPANDPWQMAFAIKNLVCDNEKMKLFSVRAKEKALIRHGHQNILNGLVNCYKTLLEKKIK